MGELHVLFDGTRSKPWGRMIFAEESTQRSAPAVVPDPPRTWGDATRRLRAQRSVLARQWYTMLEIARVIDLPLEAMDSSVSSLVRRGEMIREFQDHPGGRGGSRYQPQRYRWVR